MLIVEVVNNKKIETVNKEKSSFNFLNLDPLIKDDRIVAFLTGYTGEIGACPYYNEHFKHNCTLNPDICKKRNCQGRIFFKGFLCSPLVEIIVELSKKLEGHEESLTNSLPLLCLAY
ncbi:MAG: hypothetical protein Q6356_007370 [Candidatus Wukongarchaeota archaeon]|nr:hypothetical protein [Candidatus Wukongarchaeota archaeon]